MPWTKLDDGFWSHRKILAGGNEAAGAFARMISYAGQQLSDGHVPDSIARFIAGDESVLRALVDAGLIAESDGGWQIHDFLDYQTPRAKVEERRAATKARVEKHRKQRNAVTNGVSDASPGFGSGSGSASERKVSKASAELSEWLSHFEQLTGRGPSPQTKSEFEARHADGYSLDDLKLATAGVHDDDWHRERGLDSADYILRADKIQRHIELGRQIVSSFTDNGWGSDTRTGKTREELGIGS